MASEPITEPVIIFLSGSGLIGIAGFMNFAMVKNPYLFLSV